MKNNLLICALLLCFLPAAAQYTHPLYKFKTDVAVNHNGQPLKNAWAGGLNNPQFSTIDLNFDAVPDLFVFERGQNRILTYLAVETNGQWEWQYAPEYEKTFPADIFHWALLVDYDNDGRKDIFCFTGPGVQVFRNISTPAQGMKWELASARLDFNNNINILTPSSHISAFSDIDSDGDIDILAVDMDKVTWYRNLSMDNTGVPGLAPFVKETNNWGNFTECGCGSFIFAANASCRPMGPEEDNGVLHQGGYSLLAIDLNGDQVKDLLWGDEGCTFLTSLHNTGTPTAANMQSLTTGFPTGTGPTNANAFPAAYYEDLDFDGKKDLIVAPNLFGLTLADTIIDYKESAWLYTNQGTAAVPVFEFQQKDFLQDNMIDLGNGASAAFIDIDADGDLDMIVGNSYSSTATGVRATFALYTNQGTATNPVFTLTDSDYLNFGSQTFLHLKPVVADINGDSAQDLLFSAVDFSSGTLTGNISYFLNTAPAGASVTFGAMQTMPDSISSAPFEIPCFTDMDNDGIQDLLIGTSSGRLKYYRNTGSNSSPVYTLENGSFGGLDGSDFYGRDISPVVIDADNDGTADLVVSDFRGEVRIFPDFKNQPGTLQAVDKLVISDITSERESWFFGHSPSLAAADLNGDQLPELVVGTRGGGLQMLSPDTIVSHIVMASVEESFQVQVFPNPAKELVQINSGQAVAVAVIDVLGRQVIEAATHKKSHQLRVANLSPGIYFVKLTTQQQKTVVKRLIVTR